MCISCRGAASCPSSPSPPVPGRRAVAASPLPRRICLTDTAWLQSEIYLPLFTDPLRQGGFLQGAESVVAKQVWMTLLVRSGMIRGAIFETPPSPRLPYSDLMRLTQNPVAAYSLYSSHIPTADLIVNQMYENAYLPIFDSIPIKGDNNTVHSTQRYTLSLPTTKVHVPIHFIHCPSILQNNFRTGIRQMIA